MIGPSESGRGPLDIPPKFQPGQLVVTSRAFDALSVAETLAALARHLQGDWGDVNDEDKAANEFALKEGLRLLSAYQSEGGKTFWIISEADRSATTVLLPEEY